MAKSSKLVAAKRGRVLLVRRKRDGLWMFPGGRRRARESDKDCLRREIKEELPKLKLGRLRLWKEVNAKNRHSGRRAQCHRSRCSERPIGPRFGQAAGPPNETAPARGRAEGRLYSTVPD